MTDDAELQQLFRQELQERVEHLITGAREIAAGTVSREMTALMVREGHTIKGTARVMGYTAIAEAGQTLERRWREIEEGFFVPDDDAARALEDLAAATLTAVNGEREYGTAELKGALTRVVRLDEPGPSTGVPAAPAPAPPVTAPPATAPPAPPSPWPPVAPVPGGRGPGGAVVDVPDDRPRIAGADLRDQHHVPSPSDLGGLLGALETWAASEHIRVRAADLYQLINAVAAVGVETSGLRRLLLDMTDSIDEHPSVADQVRRISEAVDAVDESFAAAKGHALTLAAIPLSEVTGNLEQLVRYLGRKVGKEIRFEVVGDHAIADRQVLERIADPLRQLLVNAIEHGIESAEERMATGKSPTATIALRAAVGENRLEVSVADDGRGVDWGAVKRAAVRRGLLARDSDPDEETLRTVLFTPDFSTVEHASDLVGSGNGLTTALASVEALRGSILFQTEPGAGTRVVITVPTSRALQDAVLVRAAGQQWGVPETAVVAILPYDETQVVAGPHRTELQWNGTRIPLAPFSKAVGLANGDEAKEVLVLASPVGPVALTVPEVLGRREVAAKELGPLLGGAPHLTGAALLGGGNVIVLVDPARLAELARNIPQEGVARPCVLVVDDSQGARQVVAAALAGSGFRAHVAGSTAEALEVMSEMSVQALVVDFSMPGEDGIALVEAVRRTYGNVPTVMLSAVATGDDRRRAQAAGVDAYFDKSDFREGALAAALRTLVAQRARDLEAAP